jgi:hypothetical protein
VFAKAPSAQDGEVEPRIAAPVAVRKKFGEILMTVIVKMWIEEEDKFI